MDAAQREALIEARYQQLTVNPYFEGSDEATLRLNATELVDAEIQLEFLLNDDEMAAIEETLYKARSFLHTGKRHLGSAFHPDSDVNALTGEKLRVAVQYMEYHIFKLEKHHINSSHRECKSCQPCTVRLVWQADSRQLIYTT